MTLTKANLVEELYKNHNDLTKADAALAVESLLKIIKTDLINGSDVLLSGFGKFSINDKKQRRGRNPQTGEMLMLAPRRVITFRPSKFLRDKVNK